MTLRGRLIAAASAATLVAVAALGGAALLLTAHELRSSLDHALRQRASDVSRLALSAPAVLSVPGALDAPVGGRTLSVEVLDRQGRIYARSLSLGGRLLPAGAALTAALREGRTGYLDAQLSGSPVRLFVAPLADAGGPTGGGAVLVSSARGDTEDTLVKLRALLALSALAAAVLGALLAAALTHRGLRPLRRLSHAAERIAQSGRASERLPAPLERGELSALAQTLNAMLEALERARGMERRFLADASHELRTPLTSLRGNAAYVARHGADPGALADIEADAARLSRMLDDLLALEREDGAHRPQETVRLREVIETAAAADDTLDLEIDQDLYVRGERDALERALGNLIENAHIHGPQGGRIKLGLHRRDDTALLFVSDEGPGPAQPQDAFRRFWRAPEARARPGSGLGLSIVAATAARHGGSVSIHGSRFTLELPILRGLSNGRSKVDEQPEPGEV
ncbi:MAG: HAMP domain-containing sensor histidine kinase [Solirubrobacteraceae bacterium]